MATNTRPGIRREDVAAWLATQPLDGPMGCYRTRADSHGLGVTEWLLVTDAYRHGRTAAAGPLPPIPGTWYAQPLSSAAKCFDWPRGCGEYARRPGGGPAVLRHREGCANT